MAFAVPTIGVIQRTNVVLVALTAAILAWAVSSAAAIGCLLGGAVVIANLWVLAAMGKLIIAAAGAGLSARAARLGALALPLKLFIVAGLLYLVFTRAHIDGLGFGLGVLTQLVAIIIETGRASLRGAS